jgi:hypothetical protein
MDAVDLLFVLETQFALRHGEAKASNSADQCLERDLQLDPRQILADALVDAEPETEMPAGGSPDVE